MTDRFLLFNGGRARTAAADRTARTAMLKNILVHIPSERSIRPITDSAISLAMRHAAHLDAVSIGFETANLGLSIDAAAAVATIYEVEHEGALARANAALVVFEAEARNAGITYDLLPLTGGPADIAASVGTLARLYDLTVVLQPESDVNTFDNIVPQEMLFQSGGPVVFIPYTHNGPFEPKHIGIAWDGSRLAARALRDAAPFLARAQTVTIISVNEKEISADVSAATLKAHLARHALPADIVRMDADRADVQPTILSIAADTGMDLIVMGGYGHSRLGERILGGVTRGMLKSMTVPTLMSH
jgi:nucleotide-binding universal stress UspA family protein